MSLYRIDAKVLLSHEIYIESSTRRKTSFTCKVSSIIQCLCLRYLRQFCVIRTLPVRSSPGQCLELRNSQIDNPTIVPYQAYTYSTIIWTIFQAMACEV